MNKPIRCPTCGKRHPFYGVTKETEESIKRKKRIEELIVMCLKQYKKAFKLLAKK